MMQSEACAPAYIIRTAETTSLVVMRLHRQSQFAVRTGNYP